MCGTDEVMLKVVIPMKGSNNSSRPDHTGNFSVNCKMCLCVFEEGGHVIMYMFLQFLIINMKNQFYAHLTFAHLMIPYIVTIAYLYVITENPKINFNFFLLLLSQNLLFLNCSWQDQ